MMLTRAHTQTHLSIALPCQEESIVVYFESAARLVLKVLLVLDPPCPNSTILKFFGYRNFPIKLKILGHVINVLITEGIPLE
jgi:hypothetical protein